jgi:gamma-glutamyltranspeptidase/glutathione hydrolase
MRLTALVLVVVSSACSSAVPPNAPETWPFRGSRLAATSSSEGIVSTTDAVASEVGAAVLGRGGNAVDAAVATHFALAVVNPEAGNIGGGGFMVVRMAGQPPSTLDFREKAPRAARGDMFLDRDGAPTDRSRAGHLAAGVPGSVAGMWEAHAKFGTQPWHELVQPAIELAEGLVVHERLAESLQEYEARLARYPATAAAFLIDGRAPRVGDRLTQGDLAETLRRIARDGKDGFYRGQTAELVEREMQRGGGIMTREDLARYDAVWRDPIVFRYRNHTIVSMPPPSSGGITMAEILNVLEGYDLRGFGHLSRAHVHLWAEAAKRAFADRNTYLADPDFVAQPTEQLLSPAYAATRRAGIRLDRATPSGEVRPGLTPSSASLRSLHRSAEGEHTTHYSIVDGQGNAVAVTTTINSLYGNLVTVAGAGFLLNNEMDDFTTTPGAPNQFGLVQGQRNAIEPDKRMLSAMTPTIVLDESGRLKLVTGSPGGPTIITTVAQIVSNVIDFGMDVASATAAPRIHHQHLPDILYYERGSLTADVVAGLQAIGHTVQGRSGYQGDTQSIFVFPNGTRVGIADPRRGGAAVSVRRD